MYVSLQSAVSRMENKANEWFVSNNLKLNLDKTQRIIFSTDYNITKGSVVELLGLTIDDRLCWSPHIASLKNKLSFYVHIIRKLKPNFSQNTLLKIYFSLCHSHLCYGVTLWGNSTSAIQIFRLQKKVIRLIANANYFQHCQPLFKILMIMPLPTLFIYYQLLEIHKNRETFLSSSSVHHHDTRNISFLRLPRFRLTLSSRNTLQLNLFNILPEVVRDLGFYKFKQVIKKYLLNNCFYSVQEYLSATTMSTNF